MHVELETGCREPVTMLAVFFYLLPPEHAERGVLDTGWNIWTRDPEPLHLRDQRGPLQAELGGSAVTSR
jgi:hypothetical protein